MIEIIIHLPIESNSFDKTESELQRAAGGETKEMGGKLSLCC